MARSKRYESLFSERQGVQATKREILVRHDAPRALREALPQLAYGLGWGPSGMRLLVCQVLAVAPDRGKWSEYPNIADEVNYLLETCAWYRVYDIAEAVARELDQWSGERDRYAERLNLVARLNDLRLDLTEQELYEIGVAQAASDARRVALRLASPSLPKAPAGVKKSPRPKPGKPHPRRTPLA